MVEVPVDGGVQDGGVQDGGGAEPEYEEACVWSGVVEDPGFDDASVWTSRNGAVILSPGTASFPEPAPCNLGSLSQEICVPTLDSAELLQVEVSHTSGGALGAAVGFGGFWNELPNASSSWTTVRACLGERAYGNTFELAVAPNRIPHDCSTSLSVRRMDIVPAAGMCPAPGTVFNGDFEAEGGWITGSFGAIEEGVGQDGSRALSLEPDYQCQVARSTGVGSWPLPETVPTPALRFWSQGTGGRFIHVELGGVRKRIARVQNTGSATFTTVCLPPWAHGLATDLTFEMPTTGSGQCSEADNGFLRIDDITVVSNEACVADPHVLNGGFEQQSEGVVTGWVLRTFGDATAELRNNAEEARTGEGVLRFEVTRECSSATASQTIRVPEPDGENGPAVRFWYRSTGLSNASFHTEIPRPRISRSAQAEWTEQVQCVSPALATRPMEVTFLMLTPGICANTFPAERIYVDDVEAITHPDCPPE
jgi:hypothetical protein